MLHADILELYLHRRPNMNLKAKDTIKGATIFVEVNEIRSFVTIDPVLVMIPSDANAVLMPNIWGEFLHEHFTDNPRLTLLINDHFLAGVGENSPASLFVGHAIHILTGHNIALITASDI